MAVNGKPEEFYDELEIMPAENRNKYLNQKLSEAVSHAYRHAPAARERLDSAGISPADIRTVRDLEKIPIIRKNDLIELQKRNPPYGGLVTVPHADIDRVFLSPGPIYEPIQHAGIRWFARAFWAAGFRRGDIVINTFTYHLSPAGILFHEAIRDCGATAVPTGTGNTDIQVQTMHDLKVTGFVGTPSFLMTVIKRAGEMGYSFPKDFALNRAWFTGEMLAPSIRQTLEEEYGIATSQAYAVTEPGGALAYECRYKSGMHLMDEYVIEIVDPDTGKQLGPGNTGEVVVTPLHNRQWGLIRFGTGDLSSYTVEPCPCGRTSNRMMGIAGRAGDAIKVRGMFIVARQVEALMPEFEAVKRYQMVVKRKEHRDEATLNIELEDESADRKSLASRLNQRFQDVCRLKLDGVEFLVRGTLPEEQQTIRDERKWD